MYWFVFGGFIALVIGLGLSIIVLFRFVWQNSKGKIRFLAQNISLSVFSILIVLIFLELFFYSFAQSDALGYTLASRNWFKRYWIKNSLGYRDVEWTAQRLEGRTKIMVVGDSFVAGYGLKNKEDIFFVCIGSTTG